MPNLCKCLPRTIAQQQSAQLLKINPCMRTLECLVPTSSTTPKGTHSWQPQAANKAAQCCKKTVTAATWMMQHPATAGVYMYRPTHKKNHR